MGGVLVEILSVDLMSLSSGNFGRTSYNKMVVAVSRIRIAI